MHTFHCFLLFSLFALLSFAPSVHGALVLWSTRLWPQGRVPYYINSGVDEKSKKEIERAMDYLNQVTFNGVRFESTSEKNILKNYYWFSRIRRRPFLLIRHEPRLPKGILAAATVGRQRTSVMLLGDQLNLETILHELLHVLGFQHEHQRAKRRSYIKVKWYEHLWSTDAAYQNKVKVYVEFMNRFRKSPYDPLSIMHYHDLPLKEKCVAMLNQQHLSAICRRKSPFNSRLSLGDLNALRELYPGKGGKVSNPVFAKMLQFFGGLND